MFGLFRSRSLEDAINATKKVKVCGIKFVIKKLDPMATMDGSKILQKTYDIFEVGAKDAPAAPQKSEKIKAYFRDVFMACVVSPRLYRTQAEATENAGIWVDGLFTEWDIIEGLHTEIIYYSYGKKKLKSVGLPSPT